MKLHQTKSNSAGLWKRLAALGALSALAATIIVSCSDDTATNPIKATGSATDSTFEFVSNQVSGAEIDAIGLDWIDLLMNNLPGVTSSFSSHRPLPTLGRGAAQPPGDTATIIAVNFIIHGSGWIEFSATIAEFPDTFTIVDSMQFTNTAGVVFVPSDSVVVDSISKLEIRVHGSVTINAANDFIGSGSVHSSLVIEIIGRDAVGNLDTMRINATEIDTLSGIAFDSGGVQCDLNMSQISTLTNLVGLADDTTGGCPISGQARVSATIDASCTASDSTTTLDFNDTWTVTATFNSGTSATVVFENATTRWEVTEPCDTNPPPAANSFHRLVDLGKASIQ